MESATQNPVRQRVVFHPCLAPLANPLTHALLLGLHRACRSSRTLAKGEGMLRFYLQGRRPLDEQPRPEALLPTHPGEDTGGSLFRQKPGYQ